MCSSILSLSTTKLTIISTELEFALSSLMTEIFTSLLIYRLAP